MIVDGLPGLLSLLGFTNQLAGQANSISLVGALLSV